MQAISSYEKTQGPGELQHIDAAADRLPFLKALRQPYVFQGIREQLFVFIVCLLLLQPGQPALRGLAVQWFQLHPGQDAVVIPFFQPVILFFEGAKGSTMSKR